MTHLMMILFHIHDGRTLDDLTVGFLRNQVKHDLQSISRGHRVVQYHDSSTWGNGIFMTLESASGKPDRIVHSNRLTRESSRTSNGHKSTLECQCQRGTKDIASRFTARDMSDIHRFVSTYKGINDRLKRIGIQQQGRDITAV